MAPSIDQNNYFDFDNVLNIDFKNINDGMLEIEYLDFDRNIFHYQIDKFNNNLIKLDKQIVYNNKNRIEFIKMNSEEKLVLFCEDFDLLIRKNLYILYSNESLSSMLFLINPDNLELSVSCYKNSRFLGEDEFGSYFKVVESYYNFGEFKEKSKFVRINSFDFENINEIKPFNLPIKDNLISGFLFANKDFAIFKADSSDIIKAKKINIDLFKNSIYLFGKIFEIRNIFSNDGKPYPIMNDSILFYQSYESNKNVPRFNISSIDKYGNTQIIFREDHLTGTPIRDFKIYNEFMVIQLRVFRGSNIKDNYLDKLEVINLRNLERYEIKEVKLKKIMIDSYLKD